MEYPAAPIVALALDLQGLRKGNAPGYNKCDYHALW